MKKATSILSKITAISLIVLAAIGAIGAIITIASGITLGALILPIIVLIAELVIGILLLGAAKNLDTVKFLVMIIIALVLIILDRFAIGGAMAYASATFALFQSASLLLAMMKIISIYGIILMLVAIAATVLKIVMMCTKK